MLPSLSDQLIAGAWPAPEEGPSLAREIVAQHLPGTQREIPIRMPLLPARFPANDVYDKAAREIGAVLAAGDNVAVICEVCTHPPKQGSLEQCQGETCNLLVCAECKTEQGCDTCDMVADLLGSMEEDIFGD